MLFTRRERYGDLVFNGRREAAFLRKQRKERERFPLFSDQIANTQHSIAEERIRRIEGARRAEARLRAFDAGVWRKTRKLYYSLPTDLRVAIRVYWIKWKGPRTAVYFAMIVDDLSGEQARRLADIEVERQKLRERCVSQIRDTLPMEL